ncbi:putative permease [Xenococcus sp. PCC 7305]|uniref:AI-2E family transporter n=1 Tax=Xenococcus sp. PCC 7305 TaxID=102125 RepID=UPI0002AC2830|nr:AI-2E family transporter [Xenococcus sp. PCC 7305]ELS03403.1 putative permease [Xenococcus sp. PCC 7305]
MTQKRFTASLGNFVIAIALGLLLILLWQLRSLIVVLMIAVVIAATLAPIIRAAHKLGIPRWLSVLLVYLGLIATLTGVGLIIGPTVVEQIQRLIRKLPTYLETVRSLLDEMALRIAMGEPENASFISQFLDIQGVTGWAIRSSQELAIRSFDVTKGFIGGVLGSILALLLSGYMLSGSDKLLQDIVNLFPYPWNERLSAQVRPVSKRMGGYIQGRILVSAILAIAISIGLKFLGLSELALGLGVIAGFTNLIPFFGPVLGAIPALIVAIAQGSLSFFGVLLLFLIIQNIETYLLDPLLVGNSVKVPPLYQLLAVLGGAQVLGIIGALIVPPWVAGSSVLLENLYIKPKLLAEGKVEIDD